MTQRIPGRRTRFPAALAGLALVAVSAVACGDEDGTDPGASDPTSTSSSSSPSASDSPSESVSTTPSESASATPSGDPVPSPVINKAVKDAIRDDFPALIPSGVPFGWTVVSATYAGKGGGTWTISLTDTEGLPVTLLQTTASGADLAAQLLPGGQAGDTVKLSGTGRWTAYTGSAGAALAKDLSGTGVAVVGPDAETVKELAEQLLTAEDAGSDNGG